MAITEFHEPQRVQHQQTYVDQYVPMPFEVMQRAAMYKQKEADDTELQANKSLAALLKMQAIDEDTVVGNQKQLKDQRISDYEQQVQDIVSKYDGDWSMAGKEITNLARTIHSDMTRGDLAAWQKNYDAYQGNLAATKEAMEERILRGQGIAHLNKDMSSFKESGIYNAGDLGTHVDMQKILTDAGGKIKAEGMYLGDGKQLTVDPSGKMFIHQEGHKEEVTPERARLIARDIMSSNQNYMDEMAWNEQLGYAGDNSQELEDMFVRMFAYKDVNKKTQFKGVPGSGSKTTMSDKLVDTKRDILVTDEIKSDLLQGSHGDYAIATFTKDMDNYFRRANMEGKGYNGDQINEMVRRYVFEGKTVGGEPVTFVDGLERDIENMTKVERLELLTNGIVPLPDGLDTETEAYMLSGLNNALLAEKKSEFEKNEIENEFLYARSKDSNISGEQRKAYLDYENQKNGINSEYAKALAEGIANGTIATDKELEEYEKQFKRRSFSTGKTDTPDNVRARYALDYEKNRATQQLWEDNKHVKEQLDEYVESRYEFGLTSAVRGVNKYPSVDKNRIPNDVKEGDYVEAVRGAAVKKVNSPTGAFLEGADIAGNKMTIDMIKYAPDKKGKYVKSDDVELEVEFGTSTTGGNVIAVTGRDADGNPSTVILPVDSFKISTYGEAGNDLKENTFSSRANTYLTSTRDYSQTSRTPMAYDFEVFPETVVLVTDKNKATENDAYGTPSGMALVTRSESGVESKLTTNETKRLTMKAMQWQDKLDKIKDWDKRQEALLQGRKEMQTIIELIRQIGDQSQSITIEGE